MFSLVLVSVVCWQEYAKKTYSTDFPKKNHWKDGGLSLLRPSYVIHADNISNLPELT